MLPAQRRWRNLELRPSGQNVEMEKPQPTGWSRHLRNILKARREELGLTPQQVADRVAEELELKSLSHQAVRYWEKFERHPPIDRYAAWARVLGLMLIVELDSGDSERVTVRLQHPESVAVARSMESLSDAKRKAIHATVMALISTS